MGHGIGDLAVDSNFDVSINERGDLKTVVGRDRFEQHLRHRLTDRYYDIIGRLESESIPQVLQSEAERVADVMGELDRVAAFEASFSDQSPNTMIVTVIYDENEEFEFDIQG